MSDIGVDMGAAIFIGVEILIVVIDVGLDDDTSIGDEEGSRVGLLEEIVLAGQL